MERNKENKKKKVLYFVPQFPVLTETFIEREISKIIDIGDLDITVFSLAEGSGSMSENVKERVVYGRLSFFIALRALIKYVIFHPKKAHHIHQLVKGEDKIPYLLSLSTKDDERTKHSVIGRFHHSRFVHFWKGVAYAEVFSKYEPDHIHVHFLSDSSTVVMVASKFLDIPFSVSAHAIDVFVQGSLIPVKAREAKFVTICNGHAWKEVIDQANKTRSSKNIRLIYHGVDTNKLFSKGPAEKPDRPLVFTIGRFVEKKGLNYLIESSKILKERGISHLIKIVGTGVLYEDLLKQISELGLENNVEIPGDGKGISNVEVGSWLQVTDIYVAPYIQAKSGDVDGVPTGVIEASLAKVPSVVTDAGSISDLIDSSNGIVVAQRDPIQLADAIEKLIFQPDLRKELGDKAYSRANQMFDIDKNIGELNSLLLN